MRNITKQSVKAFKNCKSFKKSNTEVRIVNNLPEMYVFQNKIAYVDEWGDLWIDSCGYYSVTTRERLSGLINIRMKQGSYIINNNFEWDGKLLNHDSL